MKKGMLVMIALTLFFTFGFGQVADAKRGGGFKSPKQSVTQPKNDSASQSNPGAKTGAAAGTAGAAGKGGMFGGSSLMKGLMIGGLAGLLFGGMFGSMGAFGEIFGLLINLLAIFAIIMLIRVAFVYLKSKKKNDPDPRRPY